MPESRICAAALALALTASSAAAAEYDRQFYTGEALHQRCAAAPADADYAARRAACRGYILGVSDAIQAAQGAAQGSSSGARPTVCLGEVEADRLVEQVAGYLAAHPENRRYAASDVIAVALKATYPCR
ncbi:MAG TPA: Rap1a/Tai family immunity protein [Caulobacteraceae bacterium]|nr:Rap1a/Tai family immunity protein [Caulobacteraceae bacterium]